MRQRWSEQPAAHLAKKLPPAKRPETEPKLQAPCAVSQSDKPVVDENCHGAEEEGHSVSGGDCRPYNVGEHPRAATCCLTFELSRPHRHGAWPAGRMMYHSGKRAKCHAGVGRLQRRVRPRYLAEVDF